MSKFSKGDRVRWTQKMTPVPHPEGKTDRHGEVLPVLRDRQMTGTVRIAASPTSYFIVPEGRRFDFEVDAEDLRLLNE